MAIQWFPGYMVVARKKVAETMERTDVVTEVVDARYQLELCQSVMAECARVLNENPQ